MKKDYPIVLTIGGTDPSSGAGIQVDILTLLEHKVFPCSVITSVTSQNSRGVFSVFNIPSNVVLSQLEALFQDFDIKAVKIGMLGTRENVNVVASFFKKHPVTLLVDTILKSTSDFNLIEDEAIESLKNELFPLASLILPNLPEASRLVDFAVKNVSDMKKAALALKETGAKEVLIKGGHLDGKKCIDVLYDGENFYEFSERRLDVDMRGTGCIFSSAIAANLALKHDVYTSVKFARTYLISKLEKASPFGSGRPQLLPKDLFL